MKLRYTSYNTRTLIQGPKRHFRIIPPFPHQEVIMHKINECIILRGRHTKKISVLLLVGPLRRWGVKTSEP